MATTFEELDAQLTSGGPDAVLARLVENLRSDKKFHELFDARLMQSPRPGLAGRAHHVDRRAARAAPHQGGRRVSRGLPRSGRTASPRRPAALTWMYLRPTGDKSAIAAALALETGRRQRAGYYRAGAARERCGADPGLWAPARQLRHLQRHHHV